MGLDVKRFDGEVGEEFICSLCSKVFETPASSTCGHVFCAECLKKAIGKDIDCPKCGSSVKPSKDDSDSDKLTEELAERLSQLSLHCPHSGVGCHVVTPWGKMREHTERECEYRPAPCKHRGCSERCPMNELERHMETCDHRIVECKVCCARLPRKDMPAHQAVKRCYEELNKRKRVASARKISKELMEHRSEMLHQRHLTDQVERRITREHYFPPTLRRRTMSAGPVLQRAQSVGARVGSAMVVPHYSRNLKSAALESCRGCSGNFLSGRRPSARRHSHLKVSRTIDILVQ